MRETATENRPTPCDKPVFGTAICVGRTRLEPRLD